MIFRYRKIIGGSQVDGVKRIVESGLDELALLLGDASRPKRFAQCLIQRLSNEYMTLNKSFLSWNLTATSVNGLTLTAEETS